MTERTVRRIWSAAALMLGAFVWSVFANPPARPAEELGTSMLAPPSARWIARANLGETVLATVGRNPFRADRRAAPLPFGAPAVIGQPASPPSRPLLKVTGISGPPWSAIVEGVPGRPSGTVVRAGERVGGLLVERISRDTVRLVGADTSWTLVLTRRW